MLVADRICQGGHTLPTKVEKVDAGRPARAMTFHLRLPVDVSQTIIRTCRSLGITFGNALPVLSQLAHARVLYRRRFHSTPTQRPIDEDEWASRSTQPTYFCGPWNVRPYLDRDWYENGGAREMCLAIDFYHLTLPFMPLPQPGAASVSTGSSQCLGRSGSNLHPSKPVGVLQMPLRQASQTIVDENNPFFAFLSPQRFLYRSRLVQKQMFHMLRHQLLHELLITKMLNRLRLAKASGLAWRRRLQQCQLSGVDPTQALEEDFPNFPSTFNHSGVTFANGGASVGLVSHLPFQSRNSTMTQFVKARPSCPFYLSSS